MTAYAIEPAGHSSVFEAPTSVADAIEGFRIHALTFERLLPRTVHTYSYHLHQLLVALPASAITGDITPTQLRQWITDQEDRGIAPATLRVQCYALRAYYRWLQHTGYTGPCPLDHVRPPRRVSIERTDYTPPQADAIFDHAKKLAHAETASRRDQFEYALLATLRYTGIRRTELLDLQTAHLDLEKRRLRVMGKGQKVRTVPLPPVYVEIMQWYLDDVRPYLPTSNMLFANPRALQNHRGGMAEKSMGLPRVRLTLLGRGGQAA
ncbi:tyrosine-type recombinase/integrase [Kineococcus arenarius]|uniref:tyrosine-type recombinase/integrase n=1 Tax=Kineococcus sp. SYSU DK007 TaxID=3383128 RepID=UPI003D7C5FBB